MVLFATAGAIKTKQRKQGGKDMSQQKNKIMMNDFDFARMMVTGGEDITEWFSDNDFYLSDVIRERDIVSHQSMGFSI